jgi:hypothetical protein
VPRPEGPADPFVALSWRERISLRRQLKRSWRAGLAARNHATLQALHAHVLGATPAAVEHKDGIAEVRFDDGTTVRMTPCHRPTVRALRAAVRAGGVYLAQAAHHGQCWGLYFVTRDGRLPVLALELRVVPAGGRGGGDTIRAVGPDDRAAALV